ncbi:MAG: hypothetical protein KJ646_03375 [Nanoarchaeota archaeon]|nr:hypothetical protein [Nanoarchaeota archaeon]MBU4116908.1 hypothetical protein [Nanoarchaeota archaeon]
MDNLTDSQLEILSKMYDLDGKANMNDLTNNGVNLNILGWDDEMRYLFREKLLEIDGPSYKLTSLGIESYENHK